MKNRLILVEGIPGTGKTTTSKKIKDYLEGKGIQVKLYNEGEAHPADMGWNAYFTLDEYEELLKNNLKYAEEIKKHTQLEENYALVAYTQFEIGPNENHLMECFETHEVYDGRVDLDTFKKLHFKRWNQFSKSADTNSVVIFECSYLQNHINELMGFHDKDIEFIKAYLAELIKTVENLNPKLIYLTQPNVYETINHVAKERVSPDKTRWEDWIDRVIRYVEDSKYGKNHNLKGFEGVVEFFEARKKIELAVIDGLKIDKAIIDNPDNKWDKILNMIISVLEA